MLRSTELHDAPAGSQSAIDETKLGFLALPAELRNQIYQLMYPCAGTADLPKSDQLKTGTPTPSKALLMTCRQIYEETRPVYCAVWDGTEFTVGLKGATSFDGIYHRIYAMEVRRMEHVSRVRVIGGAGDEVE